MSSCHMCEMYGPSLNFYMKTNYKQFDKQISSTSWKKDVYKFFQSCPPISVGVKKSLRFLGLAF